MRKFQQNKTHFLTYEEVWVSTKVISDAEIQLLRDCLTPEMQVKLKRLLSQIQVMSCDYAMNYKAYGLPKEISRRNYGFPNTRIQVFKKHNIKDITDEKKYNRISFSKIVQIKSVIDLAKEIADNLEDSSATAQINGKPFALKSIIKEFKEFVKSLNDNLLMPHSETFDINPKDYKSDYISLDFDFVQNVEKGFYVLASSGDNEGFIGINKEQDDKPWHTIVRSVKNAVVFYDLADARSLGYKNMATVELGMTFKHLDANNLPFLIEAAAKIEKSKLEGAIESKGANKKTLKV